MADVMAIAHVDGHQHPTTRVAPGDFQHLFRGVMGVRFPGALGITFS